MKTIQRTERIGEYLGPVDWSYDFESHAKGMSPSYVAECKEKLKQLESGDWQATTDGGWPRVGWGRVVKVGMYDGWPFWKPVPSVCIHGTLGPEWHSFTMITSIERIREKKGETL